jgi:hypothetical protein
MYTLTQQNPAPQPVPANVQSGAAPLATFANASAM